MGTADTILGMAGLLALSGWMSGCCSQRPDPTACQAASDLGEHRTVNSCVVLSATQVAQHRSWRDLDASWDPPTNLVAQALRHLPTYLKNVGHEPRVQATYSRQLPGLLERLPDTVCQAIGVSYGSKQGVFLNCLPAGDSFSEGWRQRYIKVYDGGPRFWSVGYLPENGNFTRLHIDLGY